jgi:RNA polymerase sigma-70 factor (ECF subfamily)
VGVAARLRLALIRRGAPVETSTSLLDRLQHSPDEASWRRLDDLYRPLILRWLGRDPSLGEDACDLTQEILTVVYQELGGFNRQRVGSFRKWLRAITVHRLQGHYRKRRRRPRTGEAALEQGPLDGLADDRSELARRWDQEHNEHIVQKLLEMVAEEFSETDILAFRRQVFDGVKAGDVAAELGVPLNVVYLAKSRILARLREIGKGLLD